MCMFWWRRGLISLLKEMDKKKGYLRISYSVGLELVQSEEDGAELVELAEEHMDGLGLLWLVLLVDFYQSRQ